MAKKRQFEIAFVGLKPGIHEFNYELDDKFFLEYGAEDFKNAKVQIKLMLDKKPGFMLLKFEIGGNANVTCHRCGNPLNMNLWDENNMLVKMVDNPDEMNTQEEDPDVFYISRTESHLHLAEWFYEFAILSLPMQRMCSPEEMGGPQCNKEVLDRLKKMEERNEENNASTLWKGLEKFKKN
ncbi:MAG: DUF177 domain-containing protein [Chitinophagaceae bacterium]|nr:DUF177 domain-containing protein [Chitinophagaceae bacterium]MBK7735259.1 DUF177 domain-containing protein [Chitinophagaceae bacterium]MBL0254587.1 DUF177 domain-containing protein [Chitinophagaceae bacterium]HQY41045.1 DUF177 domain-containing protein [Ferruginibacter sp.]